MIREKVQTVSISGDVKHLGRCDVENIWGNHSASCHLFFHWWIVKNHLPDYRHPSGAHQAGHRTDLSCRRIVRVGFGHLCAQSITWFGDWHRLDCESGGAEGNVPVFDVPKNAGCSHENHRFASKWP